MSEILLVSATADVMFYEDSSKQWLRPGENGTLTSINNAGVIDAQKFSNVQLWQGGNRAIFRIIAKRIFDGRTLIEQTIFQKLKYQAATKCFHQWRNENRQVYGLSFSNEQEAERFLSFVQNALEYVSSSNGHYQPVNGHANNVNGNVHYQEAVYYQQQQANDAQHYKDADEDSLGSANSIHPNTYRKSSYSVNVANGVGAMPSNSIIQQQQQQLHTASAIQRRASQGSNSSSSNSTNGVSVNNVAYATSNTSNIISNPNVIGRLNINGPPGNPHASVVQSIVPPTQSSSTTEVAPGSACSSSSGISTAAPPAPPPPPPLPPTLSTGVPPISKNAPPPPPPPPPMLKAGNGAKPLSMAESLKQAKLRSVSTAASNGVNRTSNSNSSDSGVGSKTSTINSTTSGHVNLLSELEATIQKRKTTVEGRPSAGDVGEKRSNGVEAVPRPWQKLSNATAASSNIVSGTTDSPRIQRKATSGASLCSQDEPKPSNNGVTGSGTVTFADLERFKQEIITEVNKAKQEILLAIRQEFAQLRSE